MGGHEISIKSIFDFRTSLPINEILYIQCIYFGFVFFCSLYMQVMQGFMNAIHEDLINKHVMMITTAISAIGANL
jgi:hypothetical protein